MRMLAFADGCSAHQHLVLRTYTFHKVFFLLINSQICDIKHRGPDGILPLSRGIEGVPRDKSAPPLFVLVAHSSPCRYHLTKNPEKHLEPSKNPPTFAVSKQNNKFFTTNKQ